METAEMIQVASADKMDDDTFAKHMTARHSESLGGLPALTFSHGRYGPAPAWRAFHRRLHALRPDLEHEHGE